MRRRGRVSRTRRSCSIRHARLKPLGYRGIEAVFLRALGLVYFVAFASFAIQVRGLIGRHGILPAAAFLGRVREMLGASAYWRAPTLFWFGSSDVVLAAACWAGAVCGVLIFFGILRRVALAAAFVLYLSLVTAGQDFMGFQWDALLLEAGFLAIFFGYGPIVIWLFRWLLFRLMFESGMVKLLSGDTTWRDLTALSYHYQTQPLPTPPAWYMYQLPLWFHRMSTAAVFAIELGAPFLIFAPRRLRHLGGYSLVCLQVLIAATGNYAFFNLLTVALCLFLFDDEWLNRLRLRPRPVESAAPRAGRIAVIAVAVLVGLASGLELLNMLARWMPPGGGALLSAIAPFEIVNPYGLFQVMTTHRPEIVVEGSDDGTNWRAYDFRFKPGPLEGAPRWVAPYQPRLDWQMWFAALSNYRLNPWFLSLLGRLLDGSPEVLRLLRSNPFPGKPPRFVRALLYEYRFTGFAEGRRTGRWWSRTFLGTYVPQVSRADL